MDFIHSTPARSGGSAGAPAGERGGPAVERGGSGAGVRIVEAPLPESLDDPAAWAYLGIADVDRRIEMAEHGYDDLVTEPQEVLAGMRHQAFVTKRRFVAVRIPAGAAGAAGADAAHMPRPIPLGAGGDRFRPQPDDVVGHLFLGLPRAGNTHRAELEVAVRPGRRGEGLGTALADLGERLAREAGRTVWGCWVEHAVEPPAGPDAVASESGAGHVPAHHPSTRFLLGRGYRLGQVERHSLLDVAGAGARARRLLEQARARAGVDYRVHTWAGAAPERWLDDLAILLTRMSTDTPVGALDYVEEPWGADRVRARDSQYAEGGMGTLTTAVEHLPTGRLAGFTTISFQVDRGSHAYQDDTLVLTEHRGRRLGMLVKATNLVELARLRPGTERIHTWNALENDPMLAINEPLGFRAAGVEAAWQRVVG